MGIKQETLRTLGSRVLVFYLVLGGVGYALIDKEKYNQGVRVRTLNNLMPASYAPLIAVSYKGEPMDSRQWRRYGNYYREVIRFYPDMAEAYALLGFCYFYRGHPDKARTFYEQAYQRDPRFFWFPYQLGVLAMKAGRYEEAAGWFGRAARQPSLRYTLAVLKRGSVIYTPIMNEAVSRLGISPGARIQEAYQTAQKIRWLIEQKKVRDKRVLQRIAEMLRLEPY